MIEDRSINELSAFGLKQLIKEAIIEAIREGKSNVVDACCEETKDQ